MATKFKPQPLAELADDILETYMNGNIKDAMEAIGDMQPMTAAVVCVLIYDALYEEPENGISRATWLAALRRNCRATEGRI